MIKVALLECKSGAIAAKRGSFESWISLCFVRKPHNILCMSMLSEKRSKLKNFTPKISSCVQLIVLSVRNTNIVMQTNRQTGIFGEIWLGRALTKTFIHIPFVVTPYGFMIPFGEWALRERCSRHPSSKRYHEWCWSITVPTKGKNIKNTRLHSRNCV